MPPTGTAQHGKPSGGIPQVVGVGNSHEALPAISWGPVPKQQWISSVWERVLDCSRLYLLFLPSGLYCCMSLLKHTQHPFKKPSKQHSQDVQGRRWLQAVISCGHSFIQCSERQQMHISKGQAFGLAPAHLCVISPSHFQLITITWVLASLCLMAGAFLRDRGASP